jgi:hypothetical protein
MGEDRPHLAIKIDHRTRLIFPDKREKSRHRLFDSRDDGEDQEQ